MMRNLTRGRCSSLFARPLPRWLCGVSACLVMAAPLKADEPAATIAQHQRWVTGVGFTSDSKRLVTVGGGSLRYRPGDVLVWDVAGGKRLASLSGHDSHVWAVAMSPDRAIGATSDYTGRIVVWDFAAGKPIHQLDPFQAWVPSLAWSADGKWMAAGGQDANVAVWNTAKFEKPVTVKVHDAPVAALAFLPGTTRLVVAGVDKKLSLVDWKAGKVVAEWQGSDDVVWSIGVDPSGKVVATGGADRTVRLWKPDGTRLVSLPAHRDWIRCVRFSPDGKELATAGHDRRVRLWNVERLLEQSGPLTAKRQQVASAQAAWTKLLEASDDAEKAANLAEDKQKAAAAIVAWKQAVARQQEAIKALEQDKENKDLKKAVDEAKAAVGKLAKEVDAKIKSLGSDKKLAQSLAELKKADIDAVKKQQEAWAKEAADATGKHEELGRQSQAAEKALDQARRLLREFVDSLATDIGPLESSVWAVAYSPDGKWLATGCHRIGRETNTDTVRIWRRSDRQSVFSQKSEANSP